MARKDVRTLRDEAGQAATEGKHKRALECYVELEQLEPGEPNWPKRAAEIYRRLGKNRDAVAAYDRAAERYAQGGFLVQSIAVSKIALQIDPGHEATKRRLAAISEQQDAGRSQAGTLADRHRGIAGVDSPSVAGVPRMRTPTPGAPLRGRSRRGSSVPPFARRPGMGGSIDLEPDERGVSHGGMVLERNEVFGRGTVPPEGLDESDDVPVVITAPDVSGRDDDGDGVYHLPELGDEELSLDLEIVNEPPRATTGPISIDRGAPLDSVVLAGVMPGAQAARRGDGSQSGVIVIPLDDDVHYDDMPSLEISAHIVGPDGELTPVMLPDSDVEPEELDLDDVEEVSDLGEAHAYSAAAQDALASTPLFAGLPPAALEQLIERLQIVEVGTGDLLFRQGDHGDTLYVVVEGEVAVVSEGPPQIEIARLGPGAFFGEVALVTDQPRSATILATEPTQLFAIDRDVVRELITRHPDVLKVVLRFLRERLVDALTQTHPLFQPYGDLERRDLISRFRFLEIEPGATVIAVGARTAGLYALLAGRCQVRRDGVAVGALGPGDLFGEVSVLTGEVSDVAIVAGPRCLALCLPSMDFREIMMTHPQVLSYIGDLIDERNRAAAGSRTTRIKLV